MEKLSVDTKSPGFPSTHGEAKYGLPGPFKVGTGNPAYCVFPNKIRFEDINILVERANGEMNGGVFGADFSTVFRKRKQSALSRSLYRDINGESKTFS